MSPPVLKRADNGSLGSESDSYLGPVSRRSRKVFAPNALGKFQILWFQSCYRSSLHTRNFRRKHIPVFRYRLIENSFAGPKRFRDFRETSPWKQIYLCRLAVHKVIRLISRVEAYHTQVSTFVLEVLLLKTSQDARVSISNGMSTSFSWSLVSRTKLQWSLFQFPS